MILLCRIVRKARCPVGYQFAADLVLPWTGDAAAIPFSL